jgi:thioredoxin reductase (NADPH)
MKLTHLKMTFLKVAKLLVVPAIILLLLAISWEPAGSSSPGGYLGGLPWYVWAGGLGLFALVGAAVMLFDAMWALYLLRKPVRQESQDKPTDPKILELLEQYDNNAPNYPHPVIFDEYCIGCRACVEACPQSVLTMAGNIAVTARRDLCVEELTCQAVCPAEPKACFVAITTKEPPPQFKPDRDGSTYMASEAPGCYIIGSVAGSPLIKRAANEGAQVIHNIAEELKGLPPVPQDRYDVLIIGVGPGGFSAAVTAERLGLRYVAVEQEQVLSTIDGYPENKQVFFKPEGMESRSPLPLAGNGDRRESLLNRCERLKDECCDNIKDGESYLGVKRSEDGEYFVVRTEKVNTRETCDYFARRVVIAVGKNSARRMLNPKCIEAGTADDRVLYKSTKPETLKGKRVAVIGGGNSAVEAAIDLVGQRDGETIKFHPEEEIGEVSLLVRGDFARDLQLENKILINYCIDEGRVTPYFGANLEKVRPGEVVICDSDKQLRSIPNDYVVVRIGADYPKALLKDFGVHVP